MIKLESSCGNYWAQITRYGRFINAEIFKTNPDFKETEWSENSGWSQLTLYDKCFCNFWGGDPSEKHWIKAKSLAIKQLNLQSR